MARVLISLPNLFLNKIDATAKKELRTRSELIREAVRIYLLQSKYSDLDLLEYKEE